MSRRYRKIDPRFWKDEKIVRLTPEEKLVALYLFTAQSNRVGLFTFSPGEAAEDIGMLPQTFGERFQNVCTTLKIHWDETFRVLYIPTWWKYNPPENANNVIGNLKDVDDVPKSHLVDLFARNLDYLAENLRETFTQTLAKHLPQRSPTQEQELKQEQDIKIPPNGSGLNSSQAKKKWPVPLSDEKFEEAWADYPSRAGDNSKIGARKAWNARVREGADPTDMIAGVKRYKNFLRATGKEGTEFVKHAKTFFGPEEYYLEQWRIPTARLNEQHSGSGEFVG